MGKSDALENDWLKLLFNGTAIADLAENDATSPLTDLQVSFHTADPGDAGNQTTNEATYTGYARTAVARTSGGWTVTGNSVSPAAAIVGPTRTDVGSQVLTHWAVGTAPSGTGKILYSGPIGSDMGPCTAIAAGDLITIPGHTLVVDDRVSFSAVGGSALPTGITEGTVYWVKTVSGNDITISATQGGAAVDITAAGDARAFKHTPLTISQNGFPQLGTGTAIVED